MQAIVDTHELGELRDRIYRAVSMVYRLTATQLWGDIREESPVASGRLAGSWELAALSDLAWRISTSVDYALAVLEGTEPHEIRPVKARALAFTVDGATIFAKVVHHPGTEANPFIDRAVSRTEERIEDFVDQALDAVGG